MKVATAFALFAATSEVMAKGTTRESARKMQREAGQGTIETAVGDFTVNNDPLSNTGCQVLTCFYPMTWDQATCQCVL